MFGQAGTAGCSGQQMAGGAASAGVRRGGSGWEEERGGGGGWMDEKKTERKGIWNRDGTVLTFQVIIIVSKENKRFTMLSQYSIVPTSIFLWQNIYPPKRIQSTSLLISNSLTKRFGREWGEKTVSSTVFPGQVSSYV